MYYHLQQNLTNHHYGEDENNKPNCHYPSQKYSMAYLVVRFAIDGVRGHVASDAREKNGIHAVVEGAIRAGLKFNKYDFIVLESRNPYLRKTLSIGKGLAEIWYGIALESFNTSAAVAIEAYLKRKPFYWIEFGKRKRMHTGYRFSYSDPKKGNVTRYYTVTSINDEKGVILAYTPQYGHDNEKIKRYKASFSHEQLNAQWNRVRALEKAQSAEDSK